VIESPRVRFNDFTSDSTAQDLDAVRRVLGSGWLILGEQVTQFERSWAERCGVPHAVGVGNGLDAIEIGLRAAGIGPGDEVITTPMTAVATILGVIRAGAIPVLADIHPESALLDMESVKRCLTPATRAILLVHLYGQMKDMDLWAEFCAKHGLELLEDCAQAHDAAFEGRVAGSWGLFGAYSFYPTKNLGAAGDGGALVTVDAVIAERAASLRNYGQANRYEHPQLGMNSRLDELQAALLTSRLPTLSAKTERRRAIASRYRAEIANPAVKLMADASSPENHVHHLFVITCSDREGLERHMKRANVETLIHYPIPAHLQPPLQWTQRDPKGLLNSESHANTCLSIPCAPHLTDNDVAAVISAVNSYKEPGGG
jgi:dTDP-4-amino-4,6-dideoxygalactose transaminase